MLAYRILLTIAAPVVAIWFALRVLRKLSSPNDLRERLGLDGPATPPDGKVLWLHGASNGELTSARGLIEALLRRDPDLRIVATTNSLTGRDMVRGWNLPRVAARLAALDYRHCLRRFLDSHAPTALLLLEGDLWPNRFAMVAERGLPVMMISARISAKSCAKWQRLGRLGRQMMAQVTLLSAQDAASEQRFLSLGLARTALEPRLQLKASVSLPIPDPKLLAPFRDVWHRTDTFLAASTHEGEEEQVIAAFRAARETRPALRMILAPRHSTRSETVVALLAETGLSFAVRSAGGTPNCETDVYLADTLGEMPLWYTLSGSCFVGGSLVDKGGHTPFEPAQFGCAILNGPYLSNFAEPYAALAAANASITVENADALRVALSGLDESLQAELAQAARDALDLADQGRIETLLDAIAALSDPAPTRSA